MSKLKHTRGPWTIMGDDRTIESLSVNECGPLASVIFKTNTRGLDCSAANAALIAAAPEMLEALERALELIQEYKPSIENWSDQDDNDHGAIIKAISKAKGES